MIWLRVDSAIFIVWFCLIFFWNISASMQIYINMYIDFGVYHGLFISSIRFSLSHFHGLAWFFLYWTSRPYPRVVWFHIHKYVCVLLIGIRHSYFIHSIFMYNNGEINTRKRLKGHESWIWFFDLRAHSKRTDFIIKFDKVSFGT